MKTLDFSDVIAGYEKAKTEGNNDLANTFSQIFIKNIELDEKDNLKLEGYLYITLESLMTSYIKSMYLNNSEMRGKLKKYVFDYLSNVENDIDNDYIVEMIKEDKKLYDYIRKTNTVESLEEEVRNLNRKPISKETKKDIQLIKGKSYI